MSTPYNAEIEQAVIGAALLKPQFLDDVADLVRPEDFYRPANRQIYEVALMLREEGVEPDATLVAERLRSTGDLDRIGGSSYIVTLISQAAQSSSVEGYCKTLRDLTSLRKMLALASEMNDAVGRGETVENALKAAEGALTAISLQAGIRQFSETSDGIIDLFDSVAEGWASVDGMLGTPTGLRLLDKKLSGMRDTALIVIGARPAMGKSALATTIAGNVAIESKTPVLLFSLEMGAEEVNLRLLASRSGVSSAKWHSGYLDSDDWRALKNATVELALAPLVVDDDPSVTVDDIYSRVKRFKAQHGRGVVIIDYLQLMSGQGENRQLEISAITRACKVMAKEMRMPVVALSQLSRGLEQRADKRPMLSDLRESGAIEQDADVVIFLYRDAVYNEEAPWAGESEIIIAKQRNGPIGTVKAAFQPELTRFVDIATD